MSIINPSFGVRPLVEAALPRYFSHPRGKLGPARTFLTLIHMRIFGQRGYRRVLGELRNGLATELGWLWEDKPSSAALCKARPKLSKDHCERAFQAVYNHCQLCRSMGEFLYRGLRVIALDGTRLSLPDSPALGEHFGYAGNQHGTVSTPTAGLLMMWDVSAQQPLAFELAPYRHSERTLALKLFNRLPEQSLLVADRGFPGFEVFANLIDREQPFLMRMRKNMGKSYDAFIQGDRREEVISITTPPQLIRQGHENRTLQVRLIRIPRVGKDDLILVTNLLQKDGHSAKELSVLYATRWRIETAFREMKIWHALEEFSARHVLGIHQEIYAVMVFALLVADFEARIRQEKQNLIEQQPDQPLPTIRFNRLMISDAVVGLLVAASQGPDHVQKHLERCIQVIWRNREKRRSRSAPRVRKRPLRGFKKQGRK